MLRIQDLVVDAHKSFGNKYWLVGTAPAYEYRDGRRTENVTGYRYAICLPEKGLEKIGVKIDGKQQMEAPESGYVEVKLDGLELHFYWSNGQPQVAAKATSISLMSNKS